MLVPPTYNLLSRTSEFQKTSCFVAKRSNICIHSKDKTTCYLCIVESESTTGGCDEGAWMVSFSIKNSMYVRFSNRSTKAASFQWKPYTLGCYLNANRGWTLSHWQILQYDRRSAFQKAFTRSNLYGAEPLRSGFAKIISCMSTLMENRLWTYLWKYCWLQNQW